MAHFSVTECARARADDDARIQGLSCGKTSSIACRVLRRARLPAVSAKILAFSKKASVCSMSESEKSAPPVQTAKGLLAELQGAFPIFRDCLPLAIGIDKQLLVLRPDVSKKVLRSTLGMHTRSVPYLKVLQNAETRFNLDGSAADPVSAEHKALAAQTLREHFKQLAAKRKEKEAEKAAAAAAEAAERERAEKLTRLSEKFSRR